MLHTTAQACQRLDNVANDHGSGIALTCPYCRRPLRWVPQRWFGRGAFRCSRCGEFPDLATTAGRHHAPADTPLPLPSTPLRHDDDRPRVLMVDDSAEIRDLYAMMLEQTATVVTASRGEDALTMAATQHFDAIVLDVIMPGMDGWRTCERLKTNPATSGVPVIMLTSWDGPDVPARAERVGATAVLIKPCPLERIVIAIEAAVQRRFGGQRRWTRKPVTDALSVRVNDRPAHVMNLCYGGLCVEVEQAPLVLPTAFDIVVPQVHLSMHAETVWSNHGIGDVWMCGAEIHTPDDGWRNLVDATL